MLDQLLASQGKQIVIELANGRKISGTVLSANQQYLRLESDEGIGNIPVQAVYIVWETPAQTLTKENMDEIAGKLRDSVKANIAYTGQQLYGFETPQDLGYPMASQYEQDEIKAQIACTSFPGFSCVRSYICRPPDTCSFRFACPGSYVPSFPSGGGGACPFFACGPFQFGQPCRPFTFGGCGPFQFGQPCGPFQFGQPCGPFQFGCRPFVFGGSQCGVVGGFICGGQQFIGVAGPPRPPQAVGSTQQNPPLSPLEFSVKPEGPKEDNKKE